MISEKDSLEQVEYAIDARHMTKQYKEFLLDDVTIQVPKGMIIGFVGQNGAGKTTSIRAMLNIIKMDGGEVSMLGMKVDENEMAVKDGIGVVYDDLAFEDALTPMQIGKILKNIYSQWNMATYEGFLKEFGLPEKQKVGRMSRGMRMKLQIAIALSHNAELLIMDEPTSGLDPIVRSEILDIFMEFMQDENHSILISSHIISDLEKIADGIIFINKGKILLRENKDEILENYGVIKCSKEEADTIEESYKVAQRTYPYGVEILTHQRQAFTENHEKLVVDQPTLEEVIVLLANVGKKG